jgi:peptidyl-prolyl cis-trans isomerase A (cyclophilin A)
LPAIVEVQRNSVENFSSSGSFCIVRIMINKLLLALATLALLPAAAPPDADSAPDAPAAEYATTTVIIETTLGPIWVELETERAPVTAANFLKYADEGKFDGTAFYRAMHLDWGEQPNGLVQGGTQNDPDRTLPPIAHEPTSETGVKHVAGAISMARFAPGTATGDFSITLSPQPGLDADPSSSDPELQAGFAAFGHVVQGMDVVRAIWDSPIDPKKGEGWLKGQMLQQPVRILAVKRVAEL